MNAYDRARTAYSAATTPIRTPRSMEYEAFANVTRRMKAAGGRKNMGELAHALHENRRLWTILATHVADGSNELPTELRARIFYLAEFTAQTTSQILRRRAEPDILVEINTAVMRGLRGEEAAA